MFPFWRLSPAPFAPCAFLAPGRKLAATIREVLVQAREGATQRHVPEVRLGLCQPCVDRERVIERRGAWWGPR